MKKLYKNIWMGSFPALVSGEVMNWEIFYGSYLQTYLQRDVRELRKLIAAYINGAAATA